MNTKLPITKAVSRYRRPLNRDQLLLLHLLARFRFATAEQIAHGCGKTTAMSVQKRLRILNEQGFIAKRYEGSYKLQGKPAEHYLLPKGARILTNYPAGRKIITDQAIKRYYKNSTVSAPFVAHCLSILTLAQRFESHYGDAVGFAVRHDCTLQRYDSLPTPVPDAQIRLNIENGKQRYFYLDLFEDNVPLFICIRRIKKYFQYAEDNDFWSKMIPTILMVTESTRRQRQLSRRIAKELRESYETVNFAVTTKAQLLTAVLPTDKIWNVIELEEASLQSFETITSCELTFS